MKKIKIISISYIVILAAFFPSCERYLDVKSDSKLTTPESLSDLQALLDNGQYINSASPSLGEASADDYFTPQANYDTRPELAREAYKWNIANRSDYSQFGGSEWASLYYQVYVSNLCLELLEKLDRTPANASIYDNIKGSALFIKSKAFLQLVWLHGPAYDSNTANQDLGIPLRDASDFNVPSVRANVNDTYNKIIEGFQTAGSLLPSLPQHVLRPSKAAAYGYLARTYLSMRNYKDAFANATLSLNLKNDLLDYNDNSLVKVSASFPFAIYNKEVIYHDCDNMLVFSTVIQRNSRVDTNLVNSYGINDLRKNSFFLSSSPGMQFKGSYSGSGRWFTGLATDELYLIKAECEARLGNVSNAMNNLNGLLEKRWKAGTFTPFTATSSNEALNIILRERRKELLFRDLRWIDIKRLNKEGASISIVRNINSQSYTLKPNEKRFALPIPTDIINLTGMPQNTQ